MICYTFLLCISTIIKMSVSSTMIHFPNSTSESVSASQQIPQTLNSLNATAYGNWKRHPQSPPNFTGIRFQNDDSKEISNVMRENLIDKMISRGVLRFALQMDFALSSEDYTNIDDKNNIIFSPLSIASALSLVMLGAAGRTYKEIETVLGLAAGVDLSGSGDELHYHFGRFLKKIEDYTDAGTSTYAAMAGAIFVQDGVQIKERFANVSKNIYGSEVLNLDFIGHSSEARDVINKWVENKTYGHIPNILEYAPPPSTRIIIASALYFNGAWKNPFSPTETNWRPFHAIDSQENGTYEILQVPTMANGGEFPYYFDPILGCQVVGLPYKDHNVTMYLLLPNEPGYQALKRLRYKLTVNHLQGLADCTVETTVIITVPRMQLESTIYLKDALELLGIHTLFDPFQADLSQISDNRNVDSFMVNDHFENKNISEEQSTNAEDIISTTHQYPEHTTVNTNTSADEILKKSENETDLVKQTSTNRAESRFSNQSTNPGLYADNVIHKVTIDITELGTEAAAATVVSLTRDGTHKVVKFDRPFLFFIRHEETGSVLFWGTVLKPTPNRPVPSVK